MLSRSLNPPRQFHNRVQAYGQDRLNSSRLRFASTRLLLPQCLYTPITRKFLYVESTLPSVENQASEYPLLSEGITFKMASKAKFGSQAKTSLNALRIEVIVQRFFRGNPG